MDEIDKSELFIKCGKDLETYMMKLDLEGKAPKFWLFDRYWRMKHLYEARPFLMKLINQEKAKSSKKFLTATTVGAFGAVMLSFLSMMLFKVPVVPWLFAISSVALSFASALMNFMIMDYASADACLSYVEDWNSLRSSLKSSGIGSITLNGKPIV